MTTTLCDMCTLLTADICLVDENNVLYSGRGKYWLVFICWQFFSCLRYNPQNFFRTSVCINDELDKISSFCDKNSPSEVRPYKFIPPSFSWALPHSTRYGSSAADRPQIQLTRWPGNSPDLNPIQTVWAWIKKRWKIKNAPTWSSGRWPYCWSGSRGPRRWTSWRTCWWGCRQGCRRWLPGRVAWPDIKLIVKKEIHVFFNF